MSIGSRFCQDIVNLKAEVAELLLPSIVVDLARTKDLDRNLEKTMSLQVNLFYCAATFVQHNTLFVFLLLICSPYLDLMFFHYSEFKFASWN